MNTCNVVCSSVHQEMVFGGPFLLYSIGIVADHAEWMSNFRRTIPVLGSLKMPFWQLGHQLCSLRGKPQSHTSFLVIIKLLPNRVGKRAITLRPASSSFIAVSCSLLRIIFYLSLLILRRFRALSILHSAESTIIFPTVCHFFPREI